MLKFISTVLVAFFLVLPVKATSIELTPTHDESRISVLISRPTNYQGTNLEKDDFQQTLPNSDFSFNLPHESSQTALQENWYDRWAIKILKGAIRGWSTFDTVLKSLAIGTSISSAIINGINLDQNCENFSLTEAGTVLPAAFAITAVLRSTTEFAIKERSKQLKYLLNKDQSSQSALSSAQENDPEIRRLKMTVYAWHFLRTTFSTIAFCSASASGVAVGFSLRSPCHEPDVTKFGIALSGLFSLTSLLEISSNQMIKAHNKKLSLMQNLSE